MIIESATDVDPVPGINTFESIRFVIKKSILSHFSLMLKLFASPVVPKIARTWRS